MIPRGVLILCCLLGQPVALAQDWSRFEWVRASAEGKVSEKGAIYLPVRISGSTREYYMQLDTGSSRTMFYGIPYQQLLQKQNGRSPQAPDAKPSDRHSPVRFHGSIGKSGLIDVPVLLYKDYGIPISSTNKYPEIGTIGLDIFRDHPLIIDFPRRRFAVLGKGDSIPPALAVRAQFFDVTVRDGLLFIPVADDERQIDDIFYDTGSSLFPLVTTRSLWQQLTGRTGDEPGNEHLTISSWGKQVVMTGARIKKSLRVGSVSTGNIMVYFAPAEAENLNFEKWPFKVSGLIGNALFYDDDMVIIDLPRKRMAILRSK